jgi:hypothetical protein
MPSQQMNGGQKLTGIMVKVSNTAQQSMCFADPTSLSDFQEWLGLVNQ